MLIGDQYTDNKMYRGIKYAPKVPLLSKDLHESADTAFMKNAYIMNNIIGYGVLNTPEIAISTGGLRLKSPAVVLIDGDVSLVSSDDLKPIITNEEIESAGLSEGVVCIVGWYQHIDFYGNVRSYGGVNNDVLPVRLDDNEFETVVSTRYQFRWVPIILSTEVIDSDDPLTFTIANRDKLGNLLTGSTRITTDDKRDSVFIVNTHSIDYAISPLYVVPLFKYTYSGGSISNLSNYLPITPKGSSGFIKSSTEPVGEYTEGTVWYNPDTKEFQTYVSGIGFVANSSKMGFLQYQYVYSIPSDADTSQDIVINIDDVQEGDIIQVDYEGALLTPSEHYQIDYIKNTLTLLGFTAESGDMIHINVVRIVETSDTSTIVSNFLSHVESAGSSSVRGHVRLSDVEDDELDSSRGVAATPKLVNESKLIKSNDNTKYKLGVENGLLYLEEV